MIWNILTAVATVISMFAYIITAGYIRAQLKAVEKDRYIIITSELFTVWQSKEFMQAQMWLMHRLEAQTWGDFIAAHRADEGELAFHRVGSFYDRVGTLIRLGLIDEQEILSTMGGFAIAVWQKIEPLVREARQIENSVLFDDFERMLPSCYHCYVPSLGKNETMTPVMLQTSATHTVPLRPASHAPTDAHKVDVATLRRWLNKPEPPTILDVRQPVQVAEHPQTLPNAVRIPPDEIATRYGEISPDHEVVVYCT